jgi:Arc/MetJ family transcription regulator
MKTTIDIPNATLKEVMRNARTTVKRDAVLAAIEDYNRRCRLRSLMDRLGTSDTFMSHAELMKMRDAELTENARD